MERFFRDPNVGERVLEPGISGPACKNARHALSVLGFDGEFSHVDFGDTYHMADRSSPALLAPPEGVVVDSAADR